MERSSVDQRKPVTKIYPKIPQSSQKLISRSNETIEPQIVIIGAGLAGLTSAYRLKQFGLHAKVFEADHRYIAGRCLSNRGDFDDSQIVERGGMMIDSGHQAIRMLAQELGLTLDDILEAEKKGTEPFYFFDGTHYSLAEATRDFQCILNQLNMDLKMAGFPTLYNSFTKRGYELDHMSILDWINENVPDGINSKMGKLLDIACNVENGAETGFQSSLNLIYLHGYLSSNVPFKTFGNSDERFHIRGGNDQIIRELSERLDPDQIIRGTRLIAIIENDNGSYTLTFQNSTKTFDVKADKVILTLPFATLRTSVDYSKAGFCALKNTAIQELGMGTNSKLHVQFRDRHWLELGCNGETISDRGYQSTFEVTRTQSGTNGILVDYTGSILDEEWDKSKIKEQVQHFLNQMEPILPGITAKWNGKAIRDDWTINPFTMGSYSFRKTGQYTKFGGIEREREGCKGNCHFAGEHTSIEYQGYMNGAVESGERAAEEIIADLLD